MKFSVEMTPEEFHQLFGVDKVGDVQKVAQEKFFEQATKSWLDFLSSNPFNPTQKKD